MSRVLSPKAILKQAEKLSRKIVAALNAQE